MSTHAITRVHYFTQQFLRMQDLVDEQAYHLAMRRRHNIAHHRWGIVHGLELVEEDDAFFVQPGVACDGYGRELVVPERRPLPQGDFDDKGSDVLDVWLVYNRLAGERAAKGYAGCGNGSGDTFYRWQEHPSIWLEKPDPALPNRREPVWVPEGDLAFGPSRTPPDDPQADWPVFLGQIQRKREAPDQPFTYRVDLWDRPYAGLVGEAVVAPSGRARVQIGAESEKDERRFAVFVPDPKLPTADPRLEIDKLGKLGIRGETTLHGQLKMSGGAVVFQDVNQAAAQAVVQAVQASPWKIYRHKQGDDEQLRIELQGGSGGKNQLVVGAWDAEKKAFVPCLTINDNCSLTVHGNLTVEGVLTENQPRGPHSFTEEAQRFLAGGVLSGVGGANVLMERFYPSPPQPIVEQASDLLSSDPGLEALVEALLADTTKIVALLDKVMDDLDGRHAVLQAIANEFLQDLVSVVFDSGKLQEMFDALMTAAGEASLEIILTIVQKLITLNNLTTDQYSVLANAMVRMATSRTSVLNEMINWQPALDDLKLHPSLQAVLDFLTQ